MKQLLLVSLMALAAQTFAQSSIPAGTILPVQLNSSLRSNKARAGERITARVMQDVPLPGGVTIHAGAKIIGHVVSVTPASNGTRAQISLRFDTFIIGKQRLAITTNLRALASMLEVFEAQIPETGPDRGTSEDTWTTDQIGGEVVYRGASVARGSTLVGLSVLGTGVRVRAASNPAAKCRGAVAGNDQPQSLWVFSSDACGLYGFPDATLTHAGRTDPVGQITIESGKGDLNIRGGSGMLLRVD
jgi:hypothetical protein